MLKTLFAAVALATFLPAQQITGVVQDGDVTAAIVRVDNPTMAIKAPGGEVIGTASYPSGGKTVTIFIHRNEEETLAETEKRAQENIALMHRLFPQDK